MRDLAIILVLFAAGILILAAVGVFGGAGVVTQQHTVVIINGTVAVVAGNYTAFEVTVPAGATRVMVKGSFTSSGGPVPGIQVYLMGSSSFASWLGSHSFFAYYDSGRETHGTISASLPPGGTYYLIYSNTFSNLAPKAVQTVASLSYTS